MKASHLTTGLKPITLIALGFLLALPAQADEPANADQLRLLMPFSTLYTDGGANTILENNKTRIFEIQNNASAERRALAALDAQDDPSRLATFMGADIQSRYYNAITTGTLTPNNPNNFLSIFGTALSAGTNGSSAAKSFFATGDPDLSFPAGGSANIYGQMYNGPVQPFTSSDNPAYSEFDPRPFQIWPDPSVSSNSTTPHIEKFDVHKTWQSPSLGVEAKAIPFVPSQGSQFGATNYNTHFLQNTPAFPSGHSTQGVASSVLYALTMPTLYRESILRGSEYAESRVVMGEHHVLDTLGGRILALYNVAQYLNNGGYEDILTARDSLRTVLSATYADGQTGYEIALLQAGIKSAADIQADGTTYHTRLTYDLGDQGNANPTPVTLDEAGVLLSLRFPYLIDLGASGTDRFAAHTDIIRTTMNNEGGPLDNTLYSVGADGFSYEGWSLINLYAAAGGYGSLDSDVTVTMDASKQDVNPLWQTDTWTNDIGGTHTLTKTQVSNPSLDDTRLTLSGNNTFAGVNANGGELVLTGQNDFTGSSSVGSGGTLIIQSATSGSQGKLHAADDITVQSGGTLIVAFKENGVIAAGTGGTGTFTNNGTVLLYADPSIAGGTVLTPITSADGFAGGGTFQAYGGTWASNTFTVSNITSQSPVGDTVTINSFQLQGQRYGADFDGDGIDDLRLSLLNDSGNTTNFNFSATDLTQSGTLPNVNGSPLLQAFEFSGTLGADDVLVSFYVGEEYDINQLILWYKGDGMGAEWELVFNSLQSLGGGYYSFQAESFSSFAITIPEPGTGALFLSAAALLAWRRKR